MSVFQGGGIRMTNKQFWWLASSRRASGLCHVGIGWCSQDSRDRPVSASALRDSVAPDSPMPRFLVHVVTVTTLLPSPYLLLVRSWCALRLGSRCACYYGTVIAPWPSWWTEVENARSPHWCGSVGWASSHKAEGCRFNSWSGPWPGLHVRCS